MRTLPATELSNAGLITRCLETGSEDAWTEFIRRFQPMIAGVVAGELRSKGRGNRSTADDLVQNTFLRLVRENAQALRRFNAKDDQDIYRYLKTVARSVALDYLRNITAEKRRMEETAEPEEFIDMGAVLRPGADTSLLLLQVQRCLHRISASKRDHTIFWLAVRQGYTVQEISRLPNIGLTVKGIESCLYRLKRAVKDCVFQKRNLLGDEGKKLPPAFGGVR